MYKKTIWCDQNVQRPKTYKISDNDDGSSTLLEDFGEVTDLGTPVNALNMNRVSGLQVLLTAKRDFMKA